MQDRVSVSRVDVLVKSEEGDGNTISTKLVGQRSLLHGVVGLGQDMAFQKFFFPML